MFYQFQEDWDFINENPINKVKIKTVKYNETEIYSKEELLQILNLLKNEDILDRTIFSLMINTGIKKCEILGLYVSDVDLENETITINRNLNWNRYKQKYIKEQRFYFK